MWQKMIGLWILVARREKGDGESIQVFICPLHFFDHVESSVDDELVHVFSFVSKARSAITAEFGGPKFELEERVVARADNGEVIRHDDREWE